MTIKRGEAILGLRYVDTNDGPKALVTRWVDGKRVMTREPLPFRHYGFVRQDKKAHVDDSEVFDVDFTDAYSDGKQMRTLFGEPVVKVTVGSPSDLSKLFLANEHVQFFEADVPYGKKAFNDLDLVLPVEYKPCYCDIETDPRDVTAKAMQNAEKRLLSAAFTGNTVYCDDKPKGVSGATFLCSDDEAKIFADLNAHLQNYTCLVSWSDFDFTYLRKRALLNHYRAPYITQLEGIDMMYYFAQLVLKKTTQSFVKLVKAVEYMQHLGAKVDAMPDLGVKQDYSLVWQYFESDRAKLREYNIGDAIAMQQIDQELQLTASMYEMMRRFRIWPTEFRQHSKIEDMLKLRLARARGVVLPNRPSKRLDLDKTGKKKKGAHVFEPVPGFHEHIVVLDFASMYPSIMRSLNIGLDSLVECDKGEKCTEHFKAANGAHYRKDMLCLNSEYLDFVQLAFNDYDAELKRAKPNTLEYTIATIKRLKAKLCKNANFGITGYETGRTYNKTVFESTTATGQALILFSSDFMRGVTAAGGQA